MEVKLNGPSGDGSFDRGSLRFVGTATTVIRYGGFAILTDPNFLHAGEKIHLGYGLTSKRLTNPALEIGQLPAIDLCVLSHMHEDHWDRVASAGLPKTLPVVTTRGASKALRKQGFRATHPLQAWDKIDFVKDRARLVITAMPATHGPMLVASMLPAVIGSLLEFRDGVGELRYRIYISRDTLLHDALREIPRRYPNIDLALIHLGGTRIFGVLLTMDAKQGVAAINVIQPRRVIPIHYNDYPVFKSPLRDFKDMVKKAGLDVPIEYLNHGDEYVFRPGGAGRDAPAPSGAPIDQGSSA